MDQLKQQLERHIKEAGGTWAIALEDLDRQEVWAINGEEPFYAASVIKLPIMAAVFAMADQGKLALGECLTLKREDLVGGAGVLQHMTPGTRLPVYDLVTLMIIQSDNTATNMLIDLVGTDQIQQTMQELDMVNSQFYNKVMTVPVNLIGRNMITASDVSGLLKRFANGQSTSLHACEKMIAIMKKQQLRNGFAAHLPKMDSDIVGVSPKWEIASKSGSVPGIQHDSGIFYVGSRTMIVTVLSKDCDSLIAQAALAKMGKAIYGYLKSS